MSTAAAPPPRTAIVLLAAGSGRRVGAEQNKVLLPLAGSAVLAHSVRTALSVPDVVQVVVVVRPEDRAAVSTALAPHLGEHDLWLVDGGAERHHSEARALAALGPAIESGEITVVAVHDAARPLASTALYLAVIAAADQDGAAVPAVPTGRLSSLDGTTVEADLVAVQTPQAFGARALVDAYAAATVDGFVGTDTAACLERYTDLVIRAVPGERTNLKITFPEDVALATELLPPRSG
ncbi:MAG: IspD/TarI family cytidylyltransferase [Propionibacteriales bacterium]|nr:IspD/TarI family cytidylyltransferase [Propionibacteriales bacterium]